MVRFNAREAGTPAHVWVAAEPWARADPLDLTAIRRLMVIAAHPDDETLGAGGLITAAADRQIAVDLVVVTDGERSHPSSSERPASELAMIRRHELRAALMELAPSATIQFLGLPDGGIEPHAARLRRLLASWMRDAAQDSMVVIPWVGDGHRDHRVVGEVALSLVTEFRLTALAYPIWMWHWASPSEPGLPWRASTVLPLSIESRQRKRRAIQQFRSQIASFPEESGGGAMLHAQMLRHFDRDAEVFFTVGVTAGGAPARATSTRSSRTSQQPNASYFEAFHQRNSDPWGFDSRWYENRKRAVTLAALPRAHYRSGLEVGCSTGHLARGLADRCDDLLAVDIAAEAVTRAREHLADAPRARVEKASMPAEWPDGPFDLIVLSEIAYYWNADDLTEAIRSAIDTLTEDGDLVLCHWRHPVITHASGGDEVDAAFAEVSGLRRVVAHVEEDFILSVFSRPPAMSVARREGMLQ